MCMKKMAKLKHIELFFVGIVNKLFYIIRKNKEKRKAIKVKKIPQT